MEHNYEEIMPESIQKVLEDHGLRCVEAQNDDGKWSFEVEGFTDAGGDEFHTLSINVGEVFDLGAWRRSFADMWDAFDPWREAVIWCDDEGNPVNTPFSRGIDLYHDLEAYDRDVLEAAYNDVMNLRFLD